MRNWKNLFILLLLVVIGGMFLWNKNLRHKVKVSDAVLEAAKRVPDIPQPPVAEVPKKGGGTIAVQKVVANSPEVERQLKNLLSEGYIKDTLIAALKKANNAKDVEITKYTRLYGEASEKLTAANLVKKPADTASHILEWQSKYYWAKSDFDHKTHEYKYNIVTDFGEITEKGRGIFGTGIFGKKTDYIVGSSPDGNATFNGLKQYKKPVVQRKDAFNLSAELGGNYFLKPRNILQVFTGIRGTINPDGRFQPSIFGGYLYDPASGKIEPMVQGRISFTIFE